MPAPALLLIPFILPLLKKRHTTGRIGETNVGSHKHKGTDVDLYSDDDRTNRLKELQGIPYSFGAGDPSTPFGQPVKGIHGGLGLDCSGLAQMALVALGYLDASAPDRGAAALSVLGTLVPNGKQEVGDLIFYNTPVSHVGVILTDADENGDSAVIAASGGHSTTNGNDPNARVKVFATMKADNARFIRRIRL